MSLSRHFQFVLSENEAAALGRLNKNRQVEDPPYFCTRIHRDDTAHLRNVLDRLTQAYDVAKGPEGCCGPDLGMPSAKRYNTTLPEPERNI